jgi:uncharacterized membrane protein
MSMVAVELRADAAVRQSALAGALTPHLSPHDIIDAVAEVEHALVEFLRTGASAGRPQSWAGNEARAAAALRTAIIAWCRAQRRQRRQRRLRGDALDGLVLAVRDFSDEQLVTFCGL